MVLQASTDKKVPLEKMEEMGRSDTLRRGRWETVEPMGCGELQVTMACQDLPEDLVWMDFLECQDVAEEEETLELLVTMVSLVCLENSPTEHLELMEGLVKMEIQDFLVDQDFVETEVPLAVRAQMGILVHQVGQEMVDKMAHQA